MHGFTTGLSHLPLPIVMTRLFNITRKQLSTNNNYQFLEILYAVHLQFLSSHRLQNTTVSLLYAIFSGLYSLVFMFRNRDIMFNKTKHWYDKNSIQFVLSSVGKFSNFLAIIFKY